MFLIKLFEIYFFFITKYIKLLHLFDTIDVRVFKNMLLLSQRYVHTFFTRKSKKNSHYSFTYLFVKIAMYIFIALKGIVQLVLKPWFINTLSLVVESRFVYSQNRKNKKYIWDNEGKADLHNYETTAGWSRWPVDRFLMEFFTDKLVVRKNNLFRR